jgi:flagellar export protein FliJ
MRKFRFRLETLLSVRRTTERVKSAELADKRREEAAESGRLAALEARHAAALAEPDGPREIDAADRLRTDAFRRRMAGAVKDQRGRVTRAGIRAEESRQELVCAAQKRSVVEKLKERRRGEHRLETDRENQKLLDEVAGRMLRDESGGVARTVVILVVVYLVLFIGVLKVTGVLEKQIMPRLTGKPRATALNDSLAVPSSGVEDAARLAEKRRLVAERDSVAALSRRLDMKAREINDKIATLEALRASNTRAEAAASATAAGVAGAGLAPGIDDLAKVYGGMKAETLAPILAKLDEETLFNVVARLRGRQLARFLGAMDPALAARISERLVAGGAETSP